MTEWLGDLLHARYGGGAPQVAGEANETLATILAHRSVRNYRPDLLPSGTIEKIVAAAQSAASSSNLQTWSVISLEDVERKSAAAKLSGDQQFIRDAPVFLVFCADLARLTEVTQMAELPDVGLDYLEMFLMATVDATLAAQNAAIAAESMGLGICYVGGARNHPVELAELLDLPPRVFALFGMAIGMPAEDDESEVKPRLAQSAIWHREKYRSENMRSGIEAYDAVMQPFYADHGMTDAQRGWTIRSAKRVSTVKALTGRHMLREVLQKFGFELK